VGVDFNALTLGAFVVGPVGTEVDSSFVTGGGDSAGNFSAGAACPDGFATCVPPSVPAGSIYTYVIDVVPGAETIPNDAPFPEPATIVDPGVVSSFSLGFAPAGFNGVAGYDFTQAANEGLAFSIEEDDTTGYLTWTSIADDWTAGDAMTFFFQTTQGPSGPGGQYVLTGDLASGTAAGPLPAPIPVPPAPVPVTGSALFLLTALAASLGLSRRRA
jgi:hypothetical protein